MVLLLRGWETDEKTIVAVKDNSNRGVQDEENDKVRYSLFHSLFLITGSGADDKIA